MNKIVDNTVVGILTQIHHLNDELFEAIRREYPVGSWVSYKHGKYERNVEVVGYSYPRQLWVKGKSKERYKIDIYRCLSEDDQDRVIGLRKEVSV